MGAGGSVAPLKGRRILVVRAGALGDTILALPAVAALREAVGREGQVELLGRAPAIELARGEDLAARVHDFDRARFRAFFDAAVDASDLETFLRAFDAVVAFSRLPLLRALAERLGSAVLEVAPLPPKGTHASDHLLRGLAPLGIGESIRVPDLPIGPDQSARASRWLATHGFSAGSFIAIHPSSGSLQKNWPAERFQEIASLARARGLGVVWIEGEADAGAVARARRGASEPVARGLELGVLAALLASCAAYFGNDSGVSHLAAATAAPTLAVFGPTDPAQWAPRGRRVTVVDRRRFPLEVWGFALDLMGSR